MSITIGRGSAMRARAASGEGDAPTLLDFHSPTLALASTPILFSARGTTWMVCTLVLACLGASAVIPIDKVVTASGRLVAKNAIIVVQPLDTAIVRAIDVHEGDTVKRGQVLAQLDPTLATADLGTYRAQVESLQAEVDRLTAESQGVDYHPDGGTPSELLQSALFMQRKSEKLFKDENYQQKIDSLQTQVQRALSDVYAYSERLKVANEIEAKRRELERLQVGSQLNLLAATDSRLEVKRNLDVAANTAAQAQRDLQAMKAEWDGYDHNWLSQVAQDMTEQGRKLSDATENLHKAELHQQMVVLRADQNATVLSVAKVSTGSVLQSGQQLITLVPESAPLEAEVAVPGDEIGYVRPGDVVTLKLDTLPYTFHGTIDATVRVVSPDAFSTGQQSAQQSQASMPQQTAPVTQSSGQAYYLARVALGTSHLRDLPTGFRMVPGLPVVADVHVGKRTVLSYLMYRIMPAFQDGMREP